MTRVKMEMKVKMRIKMMTSKAMMKRAVTTKAKRGMLLTEKTPAPWSRSAK